MVKSLDKQLKELAKNIEKGLNKELAKKKVTIPVSAKGNSFVDDMFLDKASEQYLKELLSETEILNNMFKIEEKSNENASIVQNLIDNGFLSSEDGVQYYLGADGFICFARLTQKAKAFEEYKENFTNKRRNEGSLTIGTLNNTNFQGEVNNSVVQIANNNSNIEITNQLADEIVTEITDKIETYGLSDDEKQELKDLIEDVKEKQQKKPNLLKRALQGIWNFAKDVGCNVLTAYISGKCGF